MQTAERILDYLKNTYQPDAIIVYGSFADGSAWEIAFDAGGAVTNGLVSTSGALSFGEGMSVDFAGLENLAGGLGRARLKVASAGSYSGVAALNEAAFGGYAFTPSTAPYFFVASVSRSTGVSEGYSASRSSVWMNTISSGRNGFSCG